MEIVQHIDIWSYKTESGVETRYTEQDLENFENWSDSAKWSFHAYMWRVDPQWGNPFHYAELKTQFEKARTNKDYEKMDFLDRIMMGW